MVVWAYRGNKHTKGDILSFCSMEYKNKVVLCKDNWVLWCSEDVPLHLTSKYVIFLDKEVIRIYLSLVEKRRKREHFQGQLVLCIFPEQFSLVVFLIYWLLPRHLRLYSEPIAEIKSFDLDLVVKMTIFPPKLNASQSQAGFLLPQSSIP